MRRTGPRAVWRTAAARAPPARRPPPGRVSFRTYIRMGPAGVVARRVWRAKRGAAGFAGWFQAVRGGIAEALVGVVVVGAPLEHAGILSVDGSGAPAGRQAGRRRVRAGRRRRPRRGGPWRPASRRNQTGRGRLYLHMPKPVLRRPGNPGRITFAIRDDGRITMAGPGDWRRTAACPNLLPGGGRRPPPSDTKGYLRPPMMRP